MEHLKSPYFYMLIQSPGHKLGYTSHIESTTNAHLNQYLKTWQHVLSYYHTHKQSICSLNYIYSQLGQHMPQCSPFGQHCRYFKLVKCSLQYTTAAPYQNSCQCNLNQLMAQIMLKVTTHFNFTKLQSQWYVYEQQLTPKVREQSIIIYLILKQPCSSLVNINPYTNQYNMPFWRGFITIIINKINININIKMKGSTLLLTVTALAIALTLALTATGVMNSNSSADNLSHEVQLDNKYNIDLSRKYGAYTKIAYCPENLIKDWSCKDCGTYSNISDLTVIENKKTKIFGYTFYDKTEGKIIVVFRGTIDFVNEIEDLSYEQVIYHCLRCRVHLGFFEAYKSVEKETEKAVGELVKKYPNATILNTGHSLGAALTTISAVQLSKQFPNKVKEIHNFGCPRVGNEQLAKQIQGKFDRLFRVVHNHDLFAHLPQQVQNYNHYPFQVLFDQKMQNYHVCDSSGQDPTCSNSYNPGYNVADHHFYFFPMNETGCVK